jgi:hypothetical protein
MGADGSADVFSSSSTIAVAGTSVFNINESLTLDGSQLTRSSGGDVNLAAGKTLAVQNGGDAVITGAFTNNTASIIVRRRRGLDLFHHDRDGKRERIEHERRQSRRRAQWRDGDTDV